MRDFAAIDFETGKLLIEKSRKQQKVLIEKSNFTERMQGKYCKRVVIRQKTSTFAKETSNYGGK